MGLSSTPYYTHMQASKGCGLFIVKSVPCKRAKAMPNVYHYVPNNLSFDFISQYRRKQKIYEELLKSKSENCLHSLTGKAFYGFVPVICVFCCFTLY